LTANLTLALDAMGGDKAPGAIVKGIDIARRRYPDVRFLLFGDERRIAPIVKRFSKLGEICEVRHTGDAVGSEDKPSQALRRGKTTSMRLAIDAVRDGEAAGILSAGNTGALMAMAKFVLKTVPGIDRPAIAGFFPSMRGESVMLDLGANVDCTADNLAQFGLMGAAFARVVLGIQKPTVGLLNVGTEALKGHEIVKGAAEMLRGAHLPLEFAGFVEGSDFGLGTVDVFVTDGFTGNIALKATEGTARFYAWNLRRAFRRSIMSRIGYLLARPALVALRERLDPRTYNGALFVGLNGVVIKSHGGSDARGFASALGVAVDMVRGNFNEHLIEDLEAFAQDDAPPPRVAVS
jgi:glycerol-3-phosphate acyltransferase PlsX